MVTHHLITQATSSLGRSSGNNVHFICTTQAELPTVGVIDLDQAFCQDTGNAFIRTNEQWVLNLAAPQTVRAGLVTLIDGVATVNNSTVTTKTVVLAGFHALLGTSAGILTWSIVAGVSFTLTSVGATGALVATDLSQVCYLLVESP